MIRYCATCGSSEDSHPFRHPFRPKEPKSMEPEFAPLVNPGWPILLWRRFHPDAKAPSYATRGSAGLDLAIVGGPVRLVSGEVRKVRTGIGVQIPFGCVGLLTLRSSLGKQGVIQPNAPGVIDSDYRGEIHVLMSLLHDRYSGPGIGPGTLNLVDGERVAQLVIVPRSTFELVESGALEASERGEGGFGSTGKQ